jgi:hypothetical protein
MPVPESVFGPTVARVTGPTGEHGLPDDELLPDVSQDPLLDDALAVELVPPVPALEAVLPLELAGAGPEPVAPDLPPLPEPPDPGSMGGTSPRRQPAHSAVGPTSHQRKRAFFTSQNLPAMPALPAPIHGDT